MRNLGYKTKSIHVELAKPMKNLIDKYHKGYARMRNSRWFNSIMISQCYLENRQWKFEDVQRHSGEGEQLQLTDA
jgi:hypothetical protein